MQLAPRWPSPSRWFALAIVASPWVANAAEPPDDPSPVDGPDVTADVLVLPDNPAAVAYLLGRKPNAELLALMRSRRITVNRAVCLEVLGRAEIDRDDRREAAERVATFNSTTREAEILGALTRIDRLAAPDESVLDDLGRLLLEGEQPVLAKIASQVLRAAKYGKRPLTREYGWAAYVLVRRDTANVLAYAKNSSTRLAALLNALHRVPDPDLRSSVRDQVHELATMHADVGVRAAALRGLVACDPSIATIDVLLPFAVTPDRGLSALVALEGIPANEFPLERAEAYARAFAEFADSLPPQERANFANRNRSGWQNVAAIVERLPDDDTRTALRERLESVAVQNRIVRAVRREMRFDRDDITVEADRVVELRFVNPDDLPQNLLVIAPGSIEKVGAAADAMTGREAFDKAFVPDIPEVVAATGIVQPRTTAVLVFVAPTTPGDYHFVSTIAEHWRNMQGTLRVEPSATPPPMPAPMPPPMPAPKPRPVP